MINTQDYRVVSYSAFVDNGDKLRIDNATFAVRLLRSDGKYTDVPVRAHYAHAVKEVQLLTVA